jgi:DNA-binding transcriptional ArsR family regulator
MLGPLGKAQPTVSHHTKAPTDAGVITGEKRCRWVIPDPSRLFNSSLEGNTRRAIDIHEGEKVNAGAFKALVKAAVAQNDLSAKKR